MGYSIRLECACPKQRYLANISKIPTHKSHTCICLYIHINYPLTISMSNAHHQATNGKYGTRY